MRFAFTDEQLLFRDAVRDLLAKECPPDEVRAAWDAPADAPVHERRWKALAEMGVIGLMVPERHGGMGLTELDLVLLLEETGRVALPEPIVGTAAVGAPLLAEVATSELAAEWLPRVVTGDVVVLVQAGGKPSFSYAAESDLLVMVSRDEVHAVPTAEVTLTPQRSVDASRRPALVDWHRKPDTLVASGPAGWAAVNRAFDRGVLATAAQLVGLADRMIAMTVDYVKEREQFGVPVGSFQAVKHQLADAYLQLEFARPVVYRAAYSMTHDLADRSRDVSMAKVYAADAAHHAARVALQCHGAIGYTVEADLHLFMKRAWALEPMWGGVRWHLDRVAASVIGAGSSPLPDPEPDIPLGETLA
jgi:alkylation response protein AidB-like acyl-CoA dehydrogenase